MAETQMLSGQKMSLQHQLQYKGWLVGICFVSERWIDVWEESEDRQLLRTVVGREVLYVP